MKIGYARVSTEEQNLDRQMDQLKEEGCERIYAEKVTGAKKERPQLNMLFEYLRKGDTIIVTELSRLSRSVKDLFELVERIHLAGADIRSLREPWLDTTSAQGRLLFSIFSGISQFERDLIRQRTLEGISAARARGRHGGRPKVDARKIERAIQLYRDRSCSIREILEISGVSKSTLYAYLRKNG